MINENTAQTRMINLPSGHFHYLSWNAERTDLDSVVLLHGITSSAQSWVRVGQRLAERYQVYALDQRGHGDSVKPGRGGYNLRHTADDTAAFIAALGLEQPVLIGHSWGGATAMVLASGFGSEKAIPPLARVILEDPAHHFGCSDPEKLARDYTADVGRSPDELRPEITANNPGWTAADVEGKIDALQKLSREAIVHIFTETGRQGELLPLLGKITVPTLLIRADAGLGTTLDDEAWEKAQQYLSGDSRAVQIAGASHNIHRSKFEEFMRVVNDFLVSEPSSVSVHSSGSREDIYSHHPQL